MWPCVTLETKPTSICPSLSSQLLDVLSADIKWPEKLRGADWECIWDCSPRTTESTACSSLWLFWSQRSELVIFFFTHHNSPAKKATCGGLVYCGWFFGGSGLPLHRLSWPLVAALWSWEPKPNQSEIYRRDSALSKRAWHFLVGLVFFHGLSWFKKYRFL